MDHENIMASPAAFWAACAQGGGIAPQIAALLWSGESADELGTDAAMRQCAQVANDAICCISSAHAHAGMFSIGVDTNTVTWTAKSSRLTWGGGVWYASS